jgi:lipoprotein NlpI
MSGSRSGDGGILVITGDSPPSSRRCAFCLQEVGLNPSMRCPRCVAVYHADCWAANDRKCAIYGCVPAPAVPPRVRVIPVGREPSGIGSALTRGAGIFVVIALINFMRFLSTTHTDRFSSLYSDLRLKSFEARQLFSTTRSDEEEILEATFLLQSSPQDAKLYFARGAAYRRKGDLAAALWDLNKTLELNPQSGEAYHHRGHVRVDLKDLEGAASDFGHAWALDPREPESIYDRGCASYDLHAWEDCLKDFAVAYEKIPSLRTYAQIRFCLARCRMGQRTAAEKDLELFLERRSISDPWIEELLRFVAGLSNEELLFDAASVDPKERLCQANYYAGTLRLLDGDEEQARIYFLSCLETRSTEYREFASAAAELRALDAKK